MSDEVGRPHPGAGDHPLIDAVKEGALTLIEELLANGADANARDEHDWSATDWAAGRGDVAALGLLLDAGADVVATGKEQRTPYQIALAAGHLDAVELLAAAEDLVDPQAAGTRVWQPYCRAYLRSQLRRFPHWPDQAVPAGAEGDDDPVLFLHDDLTVTEWMWRGEDVVFDAVTDAWRTFCTDELGFRVPRDVDLVPPSGTAAEPGAGS